MKFENIKIGDKATVKHTITEEDIEKFVDLTGDNNKLHVDNEFAGATEFKHPVVHGMLGVSFISTVIGTKLPGDGALWFSQTLEFLRPVRVGDTIMVIGEVLAKNENARTIELKTEILNQHKQIVTTGKAKVKMIEQLKPALNKKPQSPDNPEKVVIVLGATGGIGKATAIKLAQNGFDIVIHYNKNKKAAGEIENIIRKMGRKAIAQQADLTNISEIDPFMETIKRNFNAVYGFVNCCTVAVPSIKFSNLDWHYFQDHFDINIKSSFYLLQKLLPVMEARKSGKLVFITTQAIESPTAEWLPYITSKSALKGFAQALAIEYAAKGITVNMVSPSMTDTDLLADIPRKIKMLTEARTPLKRLCTPEDIANCIAFLLSENANFITGETIRVNGGQVML